MNGNIYPIEWIRNYFKVCGMRGISFHRAWAELLHLEDERKFYTTGWRKYTYKFKEQMK